MPADHDCSIETAFDTSEYEVVCPCGWSVGGIKSHDDALLMVQNHQTGDPVEDSF